MNDAVYAFARDGDCIWIGYGYLGAGVTKYNIKTGESLHFGNFMQENGVTYSVGGITNMAVTQDHVWLVGGGVVHCLDRKTNRVIRRYYEGHGLPVSKVGCLTEIEGKVYVGLIRYGFVIMSDSNLEVENVMELPREVDLTENSDTHMSVTSIVAENGDLLINCLDDGILRINDSEEVTLVKRTQQYSFSKLKTCDDKIFLILDPIGEGE